MFGRAKRMVVKSLGSAGVAVGRHWDPWTAQERLLAGRSVRTIFDVGANVGAVTARYRRLFPDAHIYAFEPSPECVARLRSRFSEQPRITIVERGASNHVGEQTLYLSVGSTTHSLLERPKSGRAYHGPHGTVKGRITIPVTTLDTFCEAEGIERIDLLKIDVEGSELAAFEGASTLLSRRPAPVIYCEVMFVPHFEDQPLYYDIAGHLARYGYSLFAFFDVSHTVSGQIRWGNALFVSEEIRGVVDGWP